ncbi:hypothetical protein B7H23_08175 [Notoacmeibacter marinus]|uniref:GP-PDE domain-containing protein n=1 Tax=Notoacmeibacter marinus TaxID=1876515 RepID=A0A231UW71_9HYPH|nr:glycerophosphodiester phosphodiesterase family protein [Notoacmeibacter marinus]OXT00150.1 hypothetical protein B7H23_08175 [Notoacmeibacter marinus]
MPPRSEFIVERPIAHRGLHDREAGRPENTLGAAKAALDAGYAIECDVRLSADGEAMVFHDEKLERLTGQVGDFANLAMREAHALSVHDSDERIPTLVDFIALIDGKVPLVIELKGDGGGADHLALAVAKVLDASALNIAVMSFSHRQIGQLRKLLPDRPVGLVATGCAPRDLDEHRQMIDIVDFVSFNVDELDNAFCAETRERELPLICWTVRSPEQAERAYRQCDQITFEGFHP